MYAEVIPCKRLPRSTKTFTYSVPSTLEGSISVGQFFIIPWRSKEAIGVIKELHDRPPSMKVVPLREAIEATASWTKLQLEAIIELAQEYYCSPATFARQFTPAVPKRIHTKYKKRSFGEVGLPTSQIEPVVVKTIKKLVKNEQLTSIKIQQQAERFFFYQQICKEKQGQILILAPRQADLEQIYQFLNRLFPNEVISWDRRLNKNAQWRAWQQIRDGRRIVISTRSGVFLPCKKLGAIVIDQDDRAEHKQWEPAPYYDARLCAARLAAKLKIPLFQLSLTPKIEFANPSRLQILPSPPARIEVVQHTSTQPIIHPIVTDKIKAILQAKQSVVMVASHKAKARILRCLDCQQQWRCSTCQTNLYEQSDKLVCPHCQSVFNTPLACPNCQSTHLRSFGLGIDGLANTLKSVFTVPILQLSSDELIPAINSGPYLIISTPSVWESYIRQQKITVGRIVLYQPESILYFPNYQANEFFYQHINQHRSLSFDGYRQSLIIQTALQTDNALLQTIIKDDYQTFIKDELSMRRQLNYPPFAKLIKIGLRRQDDSFQQATANITKQLSPLQPLGPLFVYKKGNIYQAKWLIKLKDKSAAALDKYLDSYYNSVTIDINPV